MTDLIDLRFIGGPVNGREYRVYKVMEQYTYPDEDGVVHVYETSLTKRRGKWCAMHVGPEASE